MTLDTRAPLGKLNFDGYETPQKRPSICSTPTVANDPFHRLPFELVDSILSDLSFEEVNNCRLASRAMYKAGYPSTFWKSRFRYDHECGFTSSALVATCEGKWEGLYHWVQRHIRESDELSGDLRTRKRIWGIVGTIADLIRIAQSTPLTGSDSSQRPHEVSAETICVEKINTDSDGMHEVRRTFVEFTPTFIAGLTDIGVSFVTIGGDRVASGLRFSSDTGDSKVVGYIHKENECMLLRSRDGGPFRGLQFALDKMGIREVALNDQSLRLSHEGGAKLAVCQMLSDDLLGFQIAVDVSHVQFLFTTRC